jgi:hemoglobin-like flavoprotein
MTPQQVTLVQDSFRKIMPIAGTAADLFYDHLFEIAPAVRSLFPDNLVAQKKKFIVMLATAVNNLDQIGKVIPAVEELGRRHASYGVVDKYYGSMGTALIWALEQSLGTDFTPEVKAAWTETYMILAGAMRVAAAATPA